MLWVVASAAIASPADAQTPATATAYVANAGSTLVTQYAIGAGGLLSPLSPPTVAAGDDPSAIAVSPDGRSVYVANLFGNTVSQYDVDASSGRLSPKTPATVATGVRPRSIAVTPNLAVRHRSRERGADAQDAGRRPTLLAPAGIAVAQQPRAPFSKEQCKRGGWRTFPQFRNQGQCVAFVQRGPKP